MKRKLILLALFVGSSLFAQTDTEKFKIPKSKWVVGGSLSTSSSTAKEELGSSTTRELDSKGVNFNPNVGYAVKDNLITGLSLTLSSNKVNRGDNGVLSEVTSNGFGIAPYIQQYISLGKKIALDIKGEVSYTKSKNEFGNEITKVNNFFIGLRPGLTLKLNEKIALQTSIGSFGYSKLESKGGLDKRESDSFGLDLDLSLREFNFGILVLL